MGNTPTPGGSFTLKIKKDRRDLSSRQALVERVADAIRATPRSNATARTMALALGIREDVCERVTATLVRTAAFERTPQQNGDVHRLAHAAVTLGRRAPRDIAS